MSIMLISGCVTKGDFFFIHFTASSKNSVRAFLSTY